MHRVIPEASLALRERDSQVARLGVKVTSSEKNSTSLEGHRSLSSKAGSDFRPPMHLLQGHNATHRMHTSFNVNAESPPTAHLNASKLTVTPALDAKLNS